MEPQSCNTFVVLPPFANGSVIFGKNSDRPQLEVQEVVYIKGGFRPPRVKCTHIMIDGHSSPINSIILSKPAWMWGAAMGANDKNVAIGNEAVRTKYNEGDGNASVKRLLGMDLVRLGLERGNTAEGALDVITSILEHYGQGGPCTEKDEDSNYHNSFLIADDKEAWVLETSGKFWVAQKVTSGYRNISNGLTITTKFDKHSPGLHEQTKELGLWDGKGNFNFCKIFGTGGDIARQKEWKRLMQEGIYNNHFNVKKMMRLLRQKKNGICHGLEDAYPTQGSQVSRLCAGISVHYFTGTPDTCMSYFKPFVFTPNASVSEHTTSPNEPLREHYLYKVHKEHIIQKNDKVRAKEMFHMELECIADLDERIEKIEAGSIDISVLDSLMKECVDAEITQYILATDMVHFSI